MRQPNGSLLRAATLGVAGAVVFQFGIGTCLDYTAYLNPCGTVFAFCAPEQLDALRVDEVPDYVNFPNCTIPGACADGNPFGSVNGGVTGAGPGPRPPGPPPP